MSALSNDLLLEKFLFRVNHEMPKYSIPHHARPILDIRMRPSRRRSYKFYPIENVHAEMTPVQINGGMSAMNETLQKYFPTMIFFPRRTK